MFAGEDVKFSERLLWLADAIIKEVDVNDSTVADALGIGRSYMSGIRNGKKVLKPQSKVLLSPLLRAVNREWLLEGKGEPEVDWQTIKRTLSKHSTAPSAMGERYAAQESAEQQCREHLERFLETCEGDPTRLGWTLVELRERFPLTKFSSSVVTRAAVELLEVAAGEVLPERRGPLRKHGADERSDPEHSRPGGAVKS